MGVETCLVYQPLIKFIFWGEIFQFLNFLAARYIIIIFPKIYYVFFTWASSLQNMDGSLIYKKKRTKKANYFLFHSDFQYSYYLGNIYACVFLWYYYVTSWNVSFLLIYIKNFVFLVILPIIIVFLKLSAVSTSEQHVWKLKIVRLQKIFQESDDWESKTLSFPFQLNSLVDYRCPVVEIVTSKNFYRYYKL